MAQGHKIKPAANNYSQYDQQGANLPKITGHYPGDVYPANGLYQH